MATTSRKCSLAIAAGACAAVLAWPASPQPAHPQEALDWDEIGLMGNAGHVTGVNASRWVWRVGMTYRFHREGALGDLTP